jgi:hypothetical protein
MQPVDEYALMEWLKGEALKAHNINTIAGASCKECPATEICGNTDSAMCDDIRLIYESTIDKVITHIQNGRINQRPHVKERI